MSWKSSWYILYLNVKQTQMSWPIPLGIEYSKLLKHLNIKENNPNLHLFSFDLSYLEKSKAKSNLLFGMMEISNSLSWGPVCQVAKLSWQPHLINWVKSNHIIHVSNVQSIPKQESCQNWSITICNTHLLFMQAQVVRLRQIYR